MKLEIKLQKQLSSLSGYISWERLERHLRASGELTKDESITHLVADEKGITYYVKTD